MPSPSSWRSARAEQQRKNKASKILHLNFAYFSVALEKGKASEDNLK